MVTAGCKCFRFCLSDEAGYQSDRCRIPVTQATPAEQSDRKPLVWICRMDVHIRQTACIAIQRSCCDPSQLDKVNNGVKIRNHRGQSLHVVMVGSAIEVVNLLM